MRAFLRTDTTHRRQADFNKACSTMATPNPSVFEQPVYIPKVKGRLSPGTFVELCSGTVAMILQTSGLEHSESACLPHRRGDLLPDSLRPRRVKVALMYPFAERKKFFRTSRSPSLAPDCRHVPELGTIGDE